MYSPHFKDIPSYAYECFCYLLKEKVYYSNFISNSGEEVEMEGR